MRDCPTVEGSSIPLIIHRIQVGDCLSRQQCNYHKCHRCIFRGKAADWQPPEVSPTGLRTGERAVPTRVVEVPRPTEEPVPAGKTPRRPAERRSKKTGKGAPTPA